MPQHSEPQFASIVVVDIAQFTGGHRTFLSQSEMHRSLEELLRTAFDDAGIAWDSCYVEDRGDGKMIVVPPDVPRIRLGDRLWHRLLVGLRRYNAVHSEAAAIQLRVALNSGDVRQSGGGIVSPAVNLASRLVDAPDAKAALRSSGGELVMVVSEGFFADVIGTDHATEPESYRRITVAVKETRTEAWMRVAGQPARPAGAGPQAVLPPENLRRIRELLGTVSVPNIAALQRRATGPGVPPVSAMAEMGEPLDYLAKLNSSPAGLPPVVVFAELVASQTGNHSLRLRIREWCDEQAGLLMLEEQLAELRDELTAPVLRNSRLYLMIVVNHDVLDADLFRISFWRQDDPDEWPPARGPTRTVHRAALERYLDELVVEAEQAWREHTCDVVLEVVLPRALLNEPVHMWCKESTSPMPSPLGLEYPLVLRSLERMLTPHWHREWKRRFKVLHDDPWQAKVHHADPRLAADPYVLAAMLSNDRQSVALVLSEAPSAECLRGGDQLLVALKTGMPVLFWQRSRNDPESFRKIVNSIVEDGGLGDLASRVHKVRCDMYRDEKSNRSDVEDLVILCDDPTHVLSPEQLAD